MKKITRKLRSNRGASMIIALVFMLFCVFIGGSVLASASANVYRVEHLSDQQQYLSERSAAFLIADELEVPGSSRLKLTVIDVSRSIQPITVGNGGVVTPTADAPTVTRTITFQAPVGLKMTAMQRLMYETTVIQYLAETAGNVSMVTISDFVYDNGTDGNTADDVTIASMSDFWCQPATGSTEYPVSGTVAINGSDPIEDFPAQFKSLDGSSTLYDFVVNFGDYSQLTVTMNAFAGKKNPVNQTLITRASASVGGVMQTTDAQVTSVTNQTVISWVAPYIEKGGA